MSDKEYATRASKCDKSKPALAQRSIPATKALSLGERDGRSSTIGLLVERIDDKQPKQRLVEASYDALVAAGQWRAHSSAASTESASIEPTQQGLRAHDVINCESPLAATTSGAKGATTAPDKTTGVDDNQLRATLARHVGMRFRDRGGYTWRIEASGAFTCIAQPADATKKSVDVTVWSKNATLWHQLCTLAIDVFEPAPESTAARPAPADATTAPASATPAPPSNAPAPASTTPAPATDTPATASPRGATPTPVALAEVTHVPAAGGRLAPAMSQFIWYGATFEELNVNQVLVVSKVLQTAFGVGAPSEITPVSEALKKSKLDANKGYWWFRDSGEPAWDATVGRGTQYIRNVIPWSNRVNDISRYLAANPPGARPRFMKDNAGRLIFNTDGGAGWSPVPPEAIALKLRNIPGGLMCFATAEAMLSQAGLTANGVEAIKGIIISESYYTEKVKGSLLVKDVTIDAAQSLKAKTYIDWETRRNRPVMAGVTWDNSTHNNGDADHFLVISGHTGDGQYPFNDPGTISTKDAGSSRLAFEWKDGILQYTFPEHNHPLTPGQGRKRYVVSVIRPNTESLKDWRDFWNTQPHPAKT